MRQSKRVLGVAVIILALAVLFLPPNTRAETQARVLHSFDGKTGQQPQIGLVIDSQGNLFGGTAAGGFANCFGGTCGVIFELFPKPGGGWGYRVLYGFQGSSDGGGPVATLTMDTAGNLYGVAYAGISGIPRLCGNIFELSPGSDGKYTFSVLYSFRGVPDGCNPKGRLIFDAEGDLYGTTVSGGTADMGSVFELTPTSNGWEESLIYSFQGPDGAMPLAGVTFDSQGNLFGTTSGGGGLEANSGAVFELTSDSRGEWTEQVIHSFGGSDGSEPTAELTRDSADNFYGIAATDLRTGCGNVFSVSPSGNGTWNFNIINAFGGLNGCESLGGVVLDSQGNLYGATGGGAYGAGLAFELTPNGDRTWTERRIHSFTGADGDAPSAGVTLDSLGNIFGTADLGGPDGQGTIFELRALP